MADGFAVDRAALAETAKGLTGVVDQLKSLGLTEDAEVGEGFANLALSTAEAGLTVGQALARFCDTWAYGVHTLVEDGNQFGIRLGLSVGVYNDAENQITGSLKNLTDAAVGDPYMTDQQAASASWSQDAALLTGEHTKGGDMTAAQARQQAGEQWKDLLGDGQ